jgi:pimeloyl-ACP methyl ester carboxylesterase
VRPGLHVTEHCNGPVPVILTHGGADDAHTWDAQVKALVATGEYQVVTWDLRGHGSSDAPLGDQHYSRDHGVSDLLWVMSEAGITKARPGILIGHSLGGYLSLTVALTSPELVAALVVLSTGPGYRDDRSRQQWNDGITRIAPKLGLRADVAHLIHQPDALVMDRLSTLTCPLLVILGANDRRYLPGCEYLATRTNSELVLVPEAGHMVHRDQPVAVNEAILRFLTVIWPTDRTPTRP